MIIDICLPSSKINVMSIIVDDAKNMYSQQLSHDSLLQNYFLIEIYPFSYALLCKRKKFHVSVNSPIFKILFKQEILTLR